MKAIKGIKDFKRKVVVVGLREVGFNKIKKDDKGEYVIISINRDIKRKVYIEPQNDIDDDDYFIKMIGGLEVK